MRPWRVATMSQLISASAVGILLLLSGLLLCLQKGLNPVIAKLQGEEVVTAYIDPNLPPEGETELSQKVTDVIHTSLGAAPNMQDIQVKTVTAQEFGQHLKERYPELVRQLEDLSADAPGIVPRYISISGLLPGGTLEKVQALPGVESVETSKNRYQHSVGAVIALKKVAGFLSLGLFAALLTGMVHLARSNSLLHQESLKLLKLWGASVWTLRIPGILSAMSVGLLGGLLAFECWVFSASWLTDTIRTLSPLLSSLPAPGLWDGLALIGEGALFGFLAGSLGRIPSYARSRS